MFALLLVWEIGKPWRLAQAEVDRAIDGVRWYVDEIDRMAEGRAPLPGPVSDIAGWALGEGDMAPAAVLVEGGAYGLVGGGGVEPWRARDRGAVDGGDGGEGPAVAVPGAVPEAQDAVVLERLGGGGQAALPGVAPGGSGLEGEGGCHR
ncbi:hypothetical protein ACFV27_03620 [Streptomyces antimycoticus]|uniref:hypothetical protein n=1 Tax=Streptomyces antimycoticus TaxID=68175 RepID=UPI0036BCBBDE